MKTWKRAAGLVLATALASPAAHALYTWEAITLPASSGASCGNGTPYRFFVNRALSPDLVVVFEGGGACWEQRTCEGQGQLAATNPNGIPTNYMASATAAVGGLVTPFSSRLNPLQVVRTQAWNQVYLPYCTGDVHTGKKVRTYTDANPNAPRVQHHQGQANVLAASQWLRNNLGRPNQMLVTGFSAGGVGATAGYSALRDTLAPRGRASLIADSGPLFNAPQGGTSAQYPSLALHNRIRFAWGLDEPGALLSSFAGWSGFDASNLGTVTPALAGRYPNDRIAIALFGADEVFSAFSYAKFDAAVAGATGAAQLALLNQRWQKDIDQWLPSLAPRSNLSWYLPWYRNVLGSHCLSVVDWSGTAIEERNLRSFSALVDNTLDRGSPLRAREADQTSDLNRPVSLVATVINAVATLFGR